MTTPDSSTERHYVVRWRSKRTGAVGNGKFFHDLDTAQEWSDKGNSDNPGVLHWVIDEGACDCVGGL